MKRVMMFGMFLVVLLSLAGCKGGALKEEGVYYFGDKENIAIFPEVTDLLDVRGLYDSLEYNEKMLYGRYWLNNDKKDREAFHEQMEFYEIEYCDTASSKMEKEILTQLPYRIEAGPANLMIARYDRNYDWAELYFLTEDGQYSPPVLCTYTVEGNTVHYTPLDYYENLYDEENVRSGIKYVVGEDSISYNFSFEGPKLTLSQGETDVELHSFSFSENSSNRQLSGFTTIGSSVLEDIKYIGGNTRSLYLEKMDGTLISNGVLKLEDNGRATLYWVEEDESGVKKEHLRQFIYFDCYYSMILADKENVYYYTENNQSYEVLHLGSGMTMEELCVLGELSESELSALAEKKKNLFNELEAAFEAAEIAVAMDVQSGEMKIDTAVLFGGNSAEVTAAGKAFLDKFITAYSSVIEKKDYEGFVERTVVEGHTAPLEGSTYESGLSLSQMRADNVKQCVLSIKDIDALEAVGYSNSKPVYDQNGEVDLSGSRRVSIRFIINSDQ